MTSNAPGPQDRRRIRDGAVSTPGVHAQPPVMRLRAQCAHLLGHPVIVMIQPDTLSYISHEGKLLTADSVEESIKASGGKPLTLPPSFDSAPVPGWRARLDVETDELIIDLPSGHIFYDGTCPTNPQWRKDVAAAGSVVLITGPIAGKDDIEPVIVGGRAHWTRIPLGLSPIKDDPSPADNATDANRPEPREVIARSQGSMVVPGRSYPRQLPAEIAPWHCYIRDGGHSILIVLDSDDLSVQPTTKELEDNLVPAPVRSVERAGWRMVNGYVVCRLPFDPVSGLVTPEEDDEMGDNPQAHQAPQPVHAVPEDGAVGAVQQKEPLVGPDAVTRSAVDRCESLLRDMRRRYPSALAQLTHFADQKGAPGFGDWPDWCWVPMAGAHAVVCPTGTMLPSDPRTADLARLAALSTWRLTKGVYWVDDSAVAPHVSALWSRPGVPADRPLPRDMVLTRLPQQCVYVAWPPNTVPIEAGALPPILGAFLHLEHDFRGGRPELRIVLDTDGTWDGLIGFPVLLDRPTLSASAREQVTGNPDFAALGGDAETLVELTRLAPFLVWPVVEALIDPGVVISNWDLPGEQPQPAQPAKSGALRWKGATDATRWRVGTSAPRVGLRSV